jgi:hypothetical protein
MISGLWLDGVWKWMAGGTFFDSQIINQMEYLVSIVASFFLVIVFVSSDDG